MEPETVSREPIAIIGLGCVLPDAPDVAAFWDNVMNGHSSIREVSPERWDPELFWSADKEAIDRTYAKIGAFVADDAFDSLAYRMPPKTVEQVDPSQRWVLSATRQVLLDAGYRTGLKADGEQGREFDRDRCAVILGNAMGGEQMKLQTKNLYWPQIEAALRSDPDFQALDADRQTAILERARIRYQHGVPPITEDSMPGTLSNVAAGRVANVFDLGGKNFTTDAACASSLAALDSAIDTLRKGEADLVVWGGTDRSMDVTPYVEFSKIGALSPDGSRPFDKDANGFVMGEGCAMFLLKRLDAAERDGDKIYAVIRGMGGSSDGKGKGITAPNPAGQVKAVLRAYKDAEMDPATLGYLEAHGTSTPVGDPVELESAGQAFTELTRRSIAPGSIAVGSVKSNLGHLKSAAGAAGALKAVLALHHGKLPPSINVKTLNPRIDWGKSPFNVQTEAGDWPRPADHPRRAAVSSFGFGGTNFHVVLEEHIPGHLRTAADSTPRSHPATEAAVMTMSEIKSAATTELDTVAFARHMEEATAMEGEPVVLAASDAPSAMGLSAPSFAKTGQGPRLRELLRPFTSQGLTAPQRVAFHVDNVADIGKRLEMAQKAVANPAAARLAFNQGIYLGQGTPEGKIAFLFPGQGTQYVNMGRDLAKKYAVVRNTFAEADEILFDELDGVKLTDILWPTPDTPENRAASEDKLKLTEFTQPAVLAMDVAVLRLLKQWDVEPDMVAGHSLGEYGALVAAGVLTFADALHAVAARGREMAHVEVPDLGKMASVSADWQVVQDALKGVDGYVICANKNCPSQTVIAGSSPGVDAAVAKLQSDGVACMYLPVSAAFHSEIVAPASGPLRRVLGRLDVQPPRVRILSNVGAAPYPDDPDAIRDNLAVQVASPVEWVGIIERMYEEGVRTFIEVGPKRALTGFVADILKDKSDVRPVFANHPKKGGIQSINELYAFLGATGFQPTLPGLDDAAVYTAEFRDPEASFRHTVAAPAPTASAPAPGSAVLTPAAPAGQAASAAPAQDHRLDVISRHLESLTQELRMLRGESAPTGAPATATATTTATAVVLGPAQTPAIGISGISVGLPGQHKPLFAQDDWDRILRGENLIDALGPEDRNAMASKHITRLVKSAGGQGTFEAIDDPEQVIKLAGRRGTFDLHEWGVTDDLLETLDVTSQYAIAAGLEALHDAGIPLQRTYRQTSTGGMLPQGWALPKAIGDRTGIIFASAFPGYDALLGEVKKAGRQEAFNRKFLFHVLSMGHSQLAQFLGARGPNTQINAACASTTQAIAIAEDWIKADRCDRVIVVGADDATSDNMMEWIGSGFLASGAATTKEDVAEAALPFDARRHGMIIGMGAVGLIVEKTAATQQRGMRPIARLLATQISNSAYHGSRLDIDHIATEMQKLVAKGIETKAALDKAAGIAADLVRSPESLADSVLFMSHETYTPARGGSAAAEIHALRATFGAAANKVVVANTKGFTGHPQGAGIEDAVVLKCLQRGQVPPIPHLKEPDPELGNLTLSKGGSYDVRYGLRLAAGFGSQVAMTFTELVAREAERIADAVQYDAWLAQVSGLHGVRTEVVNRTLRIVDQGAPARTTPEPVATAPAPVARAEEVPVAAGMAATAAPVAPVGAGAPPAIASAAATGADAGAALDKVTQIVADKTGYPLELLEADLDLEADLGIDTVKQAELFGELRELFGVPLREDLQLKDYNTLRKVASYMAGGATSVAVEPTAEPTTDAPGAPVAEAPVEAQVSAPAPAGAAPDDVLEQVVQVVADKTGYPVELLEPDLDLESDLGIDTVKQAELFGELRERFGVPLREDLQLKDYNTLRKVAGYMASSAAGAATSAPATGIPGESATPTTPRTTAQTQTTLVDAVIADPSAPAGLAATPDTGSTATAAPSTTSASRSTTPAAGEPSAEVLAKVTQVIADKTGYPEDLLEPDLDLESDLGIDTVKQAELFGELREHFGVPLREDLQLKDYNTLRKVAQYMGQSQHPVAAATPTATPTATPAATPAAPGAMPATEVVATPALAAQSADEPVPVASADATTVPIRRLVPSLRPVPLPDEANAITPGLLLVVGEPELEHLDAWRDAGFHPTATLDEGDEPMGILCLATDPEADDPTQTLWEAAKAFPAVRLVVSVTSQDGAHGLVDPRSDDMAAVAGLTKALRKELPDAVVKAIDLHPAIEGGASRAVQEALRGGTRTEVCYGPDGTRCVVEVAPAPLDDATPDVAGKTLVVSGGAQGITAELLAAVAAQAPNLVLLGRTEVPEEASTWATWTDAEWKQAEAQAISDLKAAGTKPTPVLVKKRVDPLRKAAEVRRNLDRLLAAGAQVLYIPIDVTDAAAVRDAVALGRERFGAIHGVIHAAGMEVSKAIADKPREQFDMVVAIKRDGIRNLLAATRDDRLEILAGFGSVAGRFGNMGQTDYSAANDALAKTIVRVAHERGIPAAFTIAWGPWGELGMATRGGILTVLRESGVTPIPTAHGTAAFLRELGTPGARECVVAGELGAIDIDGQIVAKAWDPAVAEAESWLQTAPQDFRLLRAIETFEHGLDLVATVVLDRTNDPYLFDHAVDGVPLLPGVFGIEAFAEAARLLAPEDQVLLGAQDVRFVSPLKQHKDTPVTARLAAQAEPDGDDGTRVHCRLTTQFIGPDGKPHGEPRLHFEATIRFGANPEPLHTGDVPVCDGTTGRDRIYPPFFHGPSFQVLDSAGPVSDGEATGLWIRPEAPMFAAGEAQFLSHPLVSEGLFQLCGLRTLQREQAMSLPAGVERLDVWPLADVAEARLWCRFHGKDETGLRRFDAAACTPEGDVLIRMVGYTMVETGPAPGSANEPGATGQTEDTLPTSQQDTSPTPQQGTATSDDGTSPPAPSTEPQTMTLPTVDGVLFAAVAVGDGPDGRTMLTDAEQEQATGFPSRKRAAEWVAGRIAAKTVVLDAAPELKPREITVENDSDGVPHLRIRGDESPATLSLTHRDGWAIAAVAEAPIGIDLETIEERSDPFWEEAFGALERGHLRSLGNDALAAACAWAAKEACLKRQGTGLRTPLHSLHVLLDGEGGATVSGPFGEWGVRFFDAAGRVLAVSLPAFDETAPVAQTGTNA